MEAVVMAIARQNAITNEIAKRNLRVMLPLLWIGYEPRRYSDSAFCRIAKGTSSQYFSVIPGPGGVEKNGPAKSVHDRAFDMSIDCLMMPIHFLIMPVERCQW
jgi:hypothetical protein